MFNFSLNFLEKVDFPAPADPMMIIFLIAIILSKNNKKPRN
jgi:hypothetical protein